MAQFDVHKNPGANRASTPFVVVVQSSIYRENPRRVVIPLMKESAVSRVRRSALTPTFVVAGVPVVLMPLEIVSVPTNALGKPVASLASHATAIITAIDTLVTRAYDDSPAR